MTRGVGLSALILLFVVGAVAPAAPFGQEAPSPGSAGEQEADTVPPLERAAEHLRAQEPDSARAVLMDAAEEAYGSRATLLLRTVGILDRVDPAAGLIATEAARAFHAGERERALRILEERAPGTDEAERPVLLGFAAEVADRVDADRAAELRARLLEDHPESLEAPEAALRLARHRVRTGEGLEEAEAVLEDLLVATPNHPLAPEARQELERVRGELSGSGGGS